MTTTQNRRPLRHLATALLAIASLAGSALPCVQPPLFSPGVCIDTQSIQFIPGERFEVNIYVKGYTLFGGSPGQFCGCAINLPSLAELCEITEANVVFAGTNLPVPGFGNWQDTHDGAEAWDIIQNGNWFAFTAPVVLPLSTTLEVDICFKITGKVPPQPTPDERLLYGLRVAGIGSGSDGIAPGTSQIAEVLDIVTQALRGAVVGTDETNSLGEPIGGHISLTTLGTVMAGEVLYQTLGGGVDGSNGPVLLFANGAMTATGGAGSASLENALPSSLGVLSFGFSNQMLPYFGGTFIPALDINVVVTTDVLGQFELAFPALPIGAVGDDIFMQYWYPDAGAQQGIAGSNALLTTIQP